MVCRSLSVIYLIQNGGDIVLSKSFESGIIVILGLTENLPFKVEDTVMLS